MNCTKEKQTQTNARIETITNRPDDPV